MSLTHPPRTIRNRRLAGLLLMFAAVTALPADAPATSRPEDILGFLNQTIVWYRLLNSQEQLVNQPSDAVFLSDSRQIAEQVVRLSFEFARTESQQLTTQKTGNPSEPPNYPASSQYQNLVNLAEKTKQQIKDEEKELESLQQQLIRASGKKRAFVEAGIAESEDELELLKARSDTLQNILQFASGMSAWSGPKGLQTQIEELAHTVPVAVAESKQPAATGPSSSQAAPATTSVAVATSGDQKTESSGIFGLLAELFEFRRKLRLLHDSLGLTDALAESSRALRSPQLAQIKQLTQRSDELANQPQSQDAAQLAQQQVELKGLTRQYKQLSAVILPLGKQTILLDLYKRNLTNWQNVVQGRYSQMLKTLLFRLATLAGVVAVILGASYIWRRATFRFVQDSRRRHQFLILRRIIVIPLLLVIIVIGFANGLGSVTLFAGLSTAGLAVALQNLIQSVVGYFVLIGKYGVRVGDHIQVAGVTGDVIDIGLLRLHLVEVSSGARLRPTGRVVAFANSIVFQPNAAFFKQIPGTNFVWHEVSLTLAPHSDYRQVEEAMRQAVNRVFDDYKEKMESQRRGMERAIQGLTVEPLHPESRLHLTSTGTQVVVRYPVEMGDSGEINDRIARAVLDATGRQPRVVNASSDAADKVAAETASSES
jgi:small-conductance mechanosensitive channel